MRPQPPRAVDLGEIPVSGRDRPELRSFDDAVRNFLREQGIPGGALAVARDGYLVLVRGYGFADRATRTPVAPDALFRIASLSKPLTAAAVLALVDDSNGALTLDSPVMERLRVTPWLPAGKAADPRLKRVTLRHLLQHSGGWDRDKSGDPMFEARRIARERRVASPPDSRTVAGWGLGQPLDFDPGTRYAYSNFGYCLLGRWIEDVSGQPYDTFVQRRILARAGVTRMRVGSGRASGRLPGEVAYHTADDRAVPSVFDGDPPRVPEPYAFASLNALDAHGGWVASAADVVRFAAALDVAPKPPLISAAARLATARRPDPPLWRTPEGRPEPVYYGLGWMARPRVPRGENLWHVGKMPGTAALVVRVADGCTWAVLCNQNVDAAADIALDRALHRAAAQIVAWPAPLRPDDPGMGA